MFGFLILIVLIVVVDQLTKWLAMIYLPNLKDSVTVIPGILNFTHVENKGAALGMLDDQRWVFMILSSIAIVVLLIFLWRKPPKSMLCKISIAFLIGGGVGNMIDRTLLGFVIDFIDFCAFPEIWKWVFNVADAFVTVGTGMLAFYLVREMIRDGKREKAEKNAALLETADASGSSSTELFETEHPAPKEKETEKTVGDGKNDGTDI